MSCRTSDQQAQGRVRRRGGWTRVGLTLACRQGTGCWAWGERPGKVALASPVPSPSRPSAWPMRMALRSPDNGSPDGRVNFSDNSQRWMWGHMEESGLPAWMGAAGPFLTRGTGSGLSSTSVPTPLDLRTRPLP